MKNSLLGCRCRYRLPIRPSSRKWNVLPGRQDGQRQQSLSVRLIASLRNCSARRAKTAWRRYSPSWIERPTAVTPLILCSGTTMDCRSDRGRYVGDRSDCSGRARARGLCASDRVGWESADQHGVGGRIADGCARPARAKGSGPAGRFAAPAGVRVGSTRRRRGGRGLFGLRCFGKGSGHPANLNFGDLFGYALAETKGLPLLFKGEDFAQTDIASALSEQP